MITVICSTVDECESLDGDGVGVEEVEASFLIAAVDDHTGMHHCLLRSCYPLSLSFQCQTVHSSNGYRFFLIQLVFSLQEDDVSVRSEVALRAGDIVGEFMAVLV